MKDKLQKITITLLLIITIQLSIAGITIMNLANGLKIPDLTSLNELIDKVPDLTRYDQLIKKIEKIPYDKLTELSKATELMQRWDNEDRTNDLFKLMDLMTTYYENNTGENK